MGRRVEQLRENYTLDNFRAWTDRSRSNLGVDTLDLVQLHCPPSDVIDADATYDDLDTLVADGAIAAYGVSVETCDQALSAIARPNVASIQIILNAFRLKPLDAVLPAAAEAGVAIIARVPLASGLLSGRYDGARRSRADDHRTYNRDGSAFDVGETFSGVDYETGVRAAQEFTALVARPGHQPGRRSRSRGSGSSPASRPSSRVPATPSRPGPTPLPARRPAAAGGARRRPADLRPALPRGRARPLVVRRATGGAGVPLEPALPAAQLRGGWWSGRCRRRGS